MNHRASRGAGALVMEAAKMVKILDRAPIALNQAARGATEAPTISEMAEVGPIARWREEPNNA